MKAHATTTNKTTNVFVSSHQQGVGSSGRPRLPEPRISVQANESPLVHFLPLPLARDAGGKESNLLGLTTSIRGVMLRQHISRLLDPIRDRGHQRL